MSALTLRVAIALGLLVGLTGPTFALETAKQAAKKLDGAAAPTKRPVKRLAPGVVKDVSPARKSAETFSRHDLVEVLAADPEFAVRPSSKGRAKAKDVPFQHKIWTLDFSFKPMRFIEVDIPTEEGKFARTTIWYMVYRVKYLGKLMTRVVDKSGKAKVELQANASPIRFVPRFSLESWDVQGPDGKNLVYSDQVIPIAVPAIQAREDANRPLLNTADIEGDIPVSSGEADDGVWGVATWTDIDPATDHFSIYVKGLTNAYQWVDAKAGEQDAWRPGDPLLKGRKLTEKTLRLNFWRPSDRQHEHEEEIRYGFWKHEGDNRFGLSEEDRVDYRWLYR